MAKKYEHPECVGIGSTPKSDTTDAETFAVRGRPRRITGDEEHRLCEQYRSNPTTPYSKLADEYNTNDCTIRNTLMRNGIVVSKRRKTFSFPTTRFWKIRSTAKRKGIHFNITMPYLQTLFENQRGKCAYTGWDLTFSTYADTYDGTASLDRIDSGVGYIVGNVQWVHKDINMMKQQYSNERFLVLCHAVAKNNVV